VVKMSVFVFWVVIPSGRTALILKALFPQGYSTCVTGAEGVIASTTDRCLSTPGLAEKSLGKRPLGTPRKKPKHRV
jgi:hypothetical protein